MNLLSPILFMYFTTGKKPDKAALSLVNQLASAVPNSVLRARGRKSIENIASVCRRLAISRACIVHSSGDLYFLEVGLKSHQWLPTKIKVAKVVKAQKKELEFDGEACFEAAGHASILFASDGCLAGFSDEKAVLNSTENKLTFTYKRKKLLELDVSYEKIKGKA